MRGPTALLRRLHAKSDEQKEQYALGRPRDELAVLIVTGLGQSDLPGLRFSTQPHRDNPFSPLQIFCNVIDHMAPPGTLKYFESGRKRLSDWVITDEVVAYANAMKYVVRFVQRKKPTSGRIFV